nr:MAG TPA: hypothetical protein [Caudoviricetes sp.]
MGGKVAPRTLVLGATCIFGGKSWNFWRGGSICMGGPNRIY